MKYGYAPPDPNINRDYVAHRSHLGPNGKLLYDAGCRGWVFESAPGPRLRGLLTELRPGDSLIALAPLHIARSIAELRALKRKVEAKGAALRILFGEGDRTDPSWAECEAELHRFRVSAAQQRGCYAGNKGRPAKVDAATVKALKDSGLSNEAIATQLGINRATVFRRLKEAKATS